MTNALSTFHEKASCSIEAGVKEGMPRRSLACALVALLAGACGDSSTPPAPSGPPRAFRVLVFTKWVNYYHDSIPAGAQAIRELGDQGDFDVDVMDDPAVMDDARLDPYAAVVFLSTTVENGPFLPTGQPNPPENQAMTIMDAGQQAAFERYIRRGRGYVGIHSAGDGDYKWPFYAELVGALLTTHAHNNPLAEGVIRVEDQAHPATAGLGATWMRAEEWYNFDDPRKHVHVLLSLDESQNYTGEPRMNGDHPIAWCHEVAGGRSVYTALGHAADAFAEPLMRKHLAGAIAWAAGKQPGSCAIP
jgi:type 1 glutamine amidotransferase